MSDDVRELIAEVNELISEFEAIWGIGKRSENLRVMERLADALEATLQPAKRKNVSTSPERDKKGDDSLHDKRVEAAARAIYDAATALVPDAWECEAEDEKAWWLNHAREVLLAADAVVTEEMIAEGINGLDWGYYVDGPSVNEIARAVHSALFRGGAK